MKRIIYLSLIALVGLSACQKFLNTTPQGFLAPGQYYTGANLTAALAGVYTPLSEGSLYGNELISGLGMCNDESFWGGSGRTPSANTGYTATFNYNFTTNAINGVWTTLYNGIERANELIANINVNDSSATVQAAYGEALFLRGYYYFMLVNRFGDVPLKLTPTTSPGGLALARTPAETVYNQILQDMKLAESKVNTADKVGFSGRVSKTTVEGMMAKVYLFMAGYPLNGGKTSAVAQYDSAVVYAQKVVNSGLHSLNSSYSQVFINEAADIYDTKECMWEAEFAGNNLTALQGGGRNGNLNGILFNSTATYSNVAGSTDYIYADTGYCYGYIWATQKLYNLYAPYDARRDWAIENFNYTVNTSGTTPVITRTPISNTTPFAYNRTCAKWRRNYEVVKPANKNYTPINFPLLRYSDVLLMLAEADLNANAGNISANGLNAINAVRERGCGLAGLTAPIKSLTITNPGSGYNTTSFSGYNNASLANVNLGSGLAYASTISGGKVTAITLTSGGLGFTAATAGTIYLGNAWAPKAVYAVNQQVINNGNLYTVTTAGTSTATPPTQTTGASTASVTGAVFTYAGVAATASGTLLTKADVDLTAATMQDIQDERARELCFETARTQDLIRWNIFVPTMNDMKNQINGWSTFTTNTKALAATGYNAVAPKNVLLPIPSSEISVNKNMTQNPGW
jgi:hypothetical protein